MCSLKENIKAEAIDTFSFLTIKKEMRCSSAVSKLNSEEGKLNQHKKY